MCLNVLYQKIWSTSGAVQWLKNSVTMQPQNTGTVGKKKNYLVGGFNPVEKY